METRPPHHAHYLPRPCVPISPHVWAKSLAFFCIKGAVCFNGCLVHNYQHMANILTWQGSCQTMLKAGCSVRERAATHVAILTADSLANVSTQWNCNIFRAKKKCMSVSDGLKGTDSMIRHIQWTIMINHIIFLFACYYYWISYSANRQWLIVKSGHPYIRARMVGKNDLRG